MRKRNVWTALAAAAMVMQLVATAGPSAAQTKPETKFEFSPISGPAGTKINFTGTGCPDNPGTDVDGVFFLAQGNNNTATLPFTSTATGTFGGQYDTTGLAPGQYTTFVGCPQGLNGGGPGSTFTVTVPVV